MVSMGLANFVNDLFDALDTANERIGDWFDPEDEK